MAWLGIGALALITVLLASYAARQLYLQARELNRVKNDPRPSVQSSADDLSTALLRDVILAGAIISGLIVVIWFLAKSAHGPNLSLGGGNMNELPIAAQRGIVAIVAFLIIYGLTAEVLRQMFPERWGKAILSESTAVMIAALFAISAATNKAIYQKVIDTVTGKSVNLLMTFLGIMFAAAGAYLIWKRLTVVVRPTKDRTKSRNSSRGQSNQS